MDMTRLAADLKRLRERRGWTQDDVAAKVDVSRSYISLIEKGARQNISLEVLERITKALGGDLQIDVDPAASATAIGRDLTAEDRLYLREFAALLPLVRDPVERLVLLRTLKNAAEASQIRAAAER
jgi:transcriptional regulator with XRE-family HTH domain